MGAVVAHALNPSSWKVEAGEPGQSRLHNKTLSQKKQKKRKNKKERKKERERERERKKERKKERTKSINTALNTKHERRNTFQSRQLGGLTLHFALG